MIGMPKLLALGALVAAAIPLSGQSICKPPASSNEAKTLATLSVPIAFTGARAPSAAHGISIGLEVASLPSVDSLTAKPTECRPGKEAENTHPIDGIVRPRLAVAWHGFVLEAAWIPPIPVNGVKANLVGLAIAHPFQLSRGWYLGVRAHGVLGSLHAPVTCDDAALRNPASECYQGTRSDDSWQPGIFGAEAVVGAGTSSLRPHLGVGYSWLRPRFQVDFTNSAGSTDRTKVVVNLERVALFGGITWSLKRSSVTAEAYATPADAVAARLVVRTRVAR